jgi:uncharacterized protein (UPF0332 family)
MSFSWKEYFKLAEQLNESREEAYQRSAISRVYYAVFNLIRLKVGYNTRRQAAELSHKKLIDSLKMPSDEYIIALNLDEEDIQTIADELDFLRKERNTADYDGTATINNQKSNRSIQRAKTIFDLLFPAE